MDLNVFKKQENHKNGPKVLQNFIMSETKRTTGMSYQIHLESRVP
jgi:hypothetical protein